ncbi:hypothetical protein GEMRC1_002996 [Eukaryota sp. GEM-RC1]
MLGQVITEITNEIAGDEKNIVDSPICIEIRKKGLYDLTIIDLPGITRNPIRGQPHDIYDRIKAMYKKYILPEETIILVANVHPATADIATSESIRLSRQVDPEGLRTIGIFSHDIDFASARDNEARFFSTHPQLKKLGPNVLGVPALAKKLVEVQNQRVAHTFPSIKAKIREELSAVKKELESLPQARSDPSDAYNYFLESIHKAARIFEQCTEYESASKTLNIKSRFHEFFEECFESLRKFKKVFRTPKFRKYIEDHMKENVGHRLSNFLSSTTFNVMFRKNFQAQYSKAFEKVIDSCSDVAQKVMNHCWDLALKNNKNACNLLKDVGVELVEEMTEEVQYYCKELQSAELYQPYTVNHYYSDTLDSIEEELTPEESKEVPETCSNDESSDDDSVASSSLHLERVNTVIKYSSSLEAYWKTVLKSFTDSMFKYIRYCFLQKLSKLISAAPLEKLEYEEIVANFKDDNELEMKRRNLTSRYDKLAEICQVFSK